MRRASIHGAEARSGGNTNSRVTFPQWVWLILSTIVGNEEAQAGPNTSVPTQPDSIEQTMIPIPSTWIPNGVTRRAQTENHPVTILRTFADLTRGRELHGTGRPVRTFWPTNAISDAWEVVQVLNSIIQFSFSRVLYGSVQAARNVFRFRIRDIRLVVNLSTQTADIEAGSGDISRIVGRQVKMSSSKMPELIPGIAGQAVFTLMIGIALTGSHFSLKLELLAVVLSIGFISTFISMLLPIGKLQAILGKLGRVCVSSVVIGALALPLHVDKIWMWVIARVISLIPAIAVILC